MQTDDGQINTTTRYTSLYHRYLNVIQLLGVNFGTLMFKMPASFLTGRIYYVWILWLSLRIVTELKGRAILVVDHEYMLRGIFDAATLPIERFSAMPSKEVINVTN